MGHGESRAGSGNLSLNEAVGSLCREFEFFTLRLRVLLRSCAEKSIGYDEEEFKNKYATVPAGVILRDLLPTYESCSLCDQVGLKELQATCPALQIIIETRNDVIHSIPILVNRDMGTWYISKVVKVGGRLGKRVYEVQPEHIYFFGQSIAPFTLELVNAAALLGNNRFIAGAFNIACRPRYQYTPFEYSFDDFLAGPSGA